MGVARAAMLRTTIAVGHSIDDTAGRDNALRLAPQFATALGNRRVGL